jgi:hypothetical protein
MGAAPERPQAIERTPGLPSTPDEGTSTAECIVRRLRQTRADMLGTDDEDHYFDCHEAAGEIERLRLWKTLTDAEREAVDYARRMIDSLNRGDPNHAATLRALLERTT